MAIWKKQLAKVKKQRRISTYSRTAIVRIFSRPVIGGLLDGEFNNAAERDGIRYCELCNRFYDADYHQSHISDSMTEDVEDAAAETDSFSWCCEFCREEALILAPIRKAEDDRLKAIAQRIDTINFLDDLDAYSRGQISWASFVGNR